ncbi:uncharacterized protein LOC106179276 isoform X2 [Lingula anatina]|uniref:Uncharacterized protein LOC106179276 isoform X1 n=1 Tax=Lingula anatina TaxID=7574 RepID=A0A1S3K7N9_LINAN|nr:uncharacterized protein LOC106179276 isoform X1 [Lingula anatina]XP_013418277.1 uncharacterized protein LOC106179276 isoform X2 [Lingula anatina]XP_013418278.1 uncharacterized protein LOC106179276 isoform X2 [Lingula anatina]|eukprot:XP_013418276.1 uncharacterized protein LOC106179276 isoform X1 [Lingula anatina]
MANSVSRVCGAVLIPVVLVASIGWRVAAIAVNAFYRAFPTAGQLLSKCFNTMYAGDRSKHILITLPYSHFCEKVNWACQLSGVPVEEKGYIPIFHNITLWHTGKNSSTPVMITSQNTVLPQSTDIMRFLKERNLKKFEKDWIFPCEEAVEMDARFSEAFGYGHAAFCIVYCYLYGDSLGKHRLREVFQKGVPKWQAACVGLLWPSVEFIFTRFVNIKSADFFRKNQTIVNEVWDKVERLLADGRKNICDTPEISGADIAFAALSYPLVLPPEMNEKFMAFEKGTIPAQYYDEVKRRRNTAAGKFILRLYREHRHRTAIL